MKLTKDDKMMLRKEYVKVWGSDGKMVDHCVKSASGYIDFGDVLMAFPDGCYIMDRKRPYWEASFGIHNIFKLLHVEYVRRFSYLNLRTANKQGVRFTIRTTF